MRRSCPLAVDGRRTPGGNGLALRERLAAEAVELDTSGDVDDAGLIFAGGEVAGFLGSSWAGPVGTVADEEVRVKDLQQEGGDGQVKVLRAICVCE
jgi:hypothetical protein